MLDAIPATPSPRPAARAPRPTGSARGLALVAACALALAPSVHPARSGLAHAQSGPDVTPPAAVRDLRAAPPTLYVDRSHPAASDAGPGSETAPWRTLLHAVRTARAGQTVLIRRGTYPEHENGRVAVANSGTPGSPITFAAHPGDERQVVIPGATFQIAGRSHIVVRGLKVTGVTGTTSSRGFSIEGPGTGITLSGNETYGTRSSGIGVWGVPWNTDPGDYRHLFDIVIEGNLIRRACDGGYNECITVANGVRNVVVRDNEITESGDTSLGGEGIDFKEGVFGGRIEGNLVHGIVKVGIYLDAAGVGIGPGGVEDIEIARNVVRDITAGEGIELATEGPGHLRNIRVTNNVVRGVNKNGLVVYAHPAGSGTATGITLVNNTVVGNTRYGVRIDWPATRASGIVVRNTIARANGYGDWSVAAGSAAAEDHNLWGTDPLFVDAAAGDFRLRAGSPAVDAGSPAAAPALDFDGVPRPQGAGFDIGAFERRP